MLRLFFMGYVFTANLIWQLAICKAELQSTTIVITKTTNCQMQGLKWLLENVSSYYQYPRTYINANYRVIEDIKRLPKLHLHIERCNDGGYDCEDFQNWRIDNLCQMLTWKNQIWSELIDKTQPPFRCPIKKGVYEAHNVSIDTNMFMKWYPDLEKYRWKFQCKILNEENNIVYCAILEAYYPIFRKQNRKPSKNPRYNATENIQ